MDAIYEIYSPSIYNQDLLLRNIRSLMEEKEGYASLDYLSIQLDIDKKKLKAVLKENEEFKKSFIVKGDGNPVYRLNKSFGILIDAWKTFCHLKYTGFACLGSYTKNVLRSNSSMSCFKLRNLCEVKVLTGRVTNRIGNN